jgi:DNA adenine methylase
MDLFGNISGAKPFLKWAGGKGKLWSTIQVALPAEMLTEPLTYVEPFIGGGAVLFRLLSQYPNIHRAIINDINPDLYEAYQTIQQRPEALVEVLQGIQETYDNLVSEEERRAYFDALRTEFNKRDIEPLRNTALLIALNKTCFNGLYRVNSKGKFNVPFGKYERPRICDPQTIRANSELLQRVTILKGDFSKTIEQVSGRAFYYMDPPYKPLSATASFNSYVSEAFDDASQLRLAEFCRELDAAGHLWLMSNSDVKNTDQDNHFFDELYQDFQIQRIRAKRAINSNGEKRGEISELLIANYVHEEVPQMV